MAAAGASLSTTLNVANLYGQLASSYGPTTEMDSNYPYLPAHNVQDISNGFNDGQIGHLCSIYQ